MKFLNFSPDQGYWLPPAVTGVLSSNDLCFSIRRMVEKFRLSGFESDCGEKGALGLSSGPDGGRVAVRFGVGKASSWRREQRVTKDLTFRDLAAGAGECRQWLLYLGEGSRVGARGDRPLCAGRRAWSEPGEPRIRHLAEGVRRRLEFERPKTAVTTGCTWRPSLLRNQLPHKLRSRAPIQSAPQRRLSDQVVRIGLQPRRRPGIPPLLVQACEFFRHRKDELAISLREAGGNPPQFPQERSLGL
jgi:hypothetical protein